RGDGPFFTDPVQTGRKRLTIRAAPGTHPVIELDLDAAKHDPAGNDYLLLAHAPLTLEGLEFRRLNEKPWQRGTFLPDIILSDSALHIANCRFILGRARDTILNLRGPLVDVRNCDFYGGDQCYHVDWVCPPGGRLVLHNNLVGAGRGGLGFHYHHDRDLSDVSLQVTRNNVRADIPVACFFDRLPPPAAKPV